MAKKFFNNMPEVDIIALRNSLGLEQLENIISLTFPQDGSTQLIRSFGGETSNYWWLKQVKLVLLGDDLTENAVIADYENQQIDAGADLTGASGQVMVKIPKIYFKETLDLNGTLIRVDVAPIKLAGFACHPKFVRPDGTERDYIYIGRYEAGSDGGTKLSSVSGVAPLTGVALATFRSRAFARGAGWYPYDYYTHHLLQLLFYVYYADFNSQAKLPGYTEASAYADAYKRTSGRSDNLTTMNGSVDADLAGIDAELVAAGITAGEKIANQFLFIENIFGHLWKMLDGIAFDGRIGQPNTAYVTADPTKFSSVDAEILANYDNLNVNLPAATNENYIQSLQSFFLPKVHGGGSSTYVTDYFWSYLDDETRNYLRLVRAGGALAYGGKAGLAARLSDGGLSLAISDSGSRLCAAP